VRTVGVGRVDAVLLIDELISFGESLRIRINATCAEHNHSMRMLMRWFPWWTNGFSKLPPSQKHRVALYFAHYNFIRNNQTIKTTRATTAGVADMPSPVVDFVYRSPRCWRCGP